MIQKLGKYAIVRKLGEGAMGAVYEAYDQVLDRHVAIKTMAEGVEWEPEMKLRFYREAKLAAALHHPNIVVIHDLGKEGKTAYIVMELLEGKDLKTIIQSKDPLPLEQKLSIMIQVSEGLNHAHKHGVVHRDIKPSNIFVSSSGNVKILDFGIARMPASDLTKAGVRLGTPIYMAPEQIRDQAYDLRADIFSAGVVFYELIAYSHPFRDRNVIKTLENIVSQSPLSLAQLVPNAPPGLWSILNNCLEKDPATRAANMGDVALACRNLLDDLNAESKKMARELEELLPRLRLSSESSGSNARIRKLISDAQEFMGDNRKSDYLSLKPLLAALAEESTATLEMPATIALQPQGLSQAASPRTPPAPVTPQPSPNEIRGMAALEMGKSLLGEGLLEEALAQFRLAMEDIGSQPELVNALSETRRRIEAKNRARIAQQLDSVRSLIAEKRFEEAIKTIDELLQAGIENAEAMKLRYQAMSQLQAEKASAARKEEGKKARDIGFRLLSDKKYREALAALRQASELLGEDASISAAMEEATRLLRAQELRARMDEGMAKARQLLGQEDFAGARTQIEAILKLSPDSTEASELLSKVDQFEAERQKRNRITGLLVSAREALIRREFTAAGFAIQEILQIEPQNAEAASVVRQIEQAKEQQYKREVIAGLLLKAEVALDQHDFRQAADYANEALQVEYNNAEAAAFLERIRHAEAKKRKQDEIAALLLIGREALKQQNIPVAEDKTRQALELDGNSSEAQNLLTLIHHAREIQKQEKIAALLTRCQETRSRQQFIEASNIAKEVLDLDPRNEEAKALLKTIAKEDRKWQKEQAKTEKLREKQREREKAKAESPDDSTLVLHPSGWPPRWISKTAVWISLAAAVVVIAAILVWRLHPGVPPPNPLAAAQESLNQKDFTKARELAKELAERGDPRAKEIVAQSEKGLEEQKATRINGLLSRAQDLREQGKIEESRDLFREILSLDPQDERAQRAISELTGVVNPIPNKEELDEETRSHLERARAFLREDKLPEARAEIDAVLKAHPDLTEAKNLNGRLKRRKQELDERLASEAREANYQQQLADARNQYGQAERLFAQGKYSEAGLRLDELAKRECMQNPRSNELAEQAKSLLNRTKAAQQQFNIYTSADESQKYDEALAALEDLRKINPQHPDIDRLRDTVTDRRNKQVEAARQTKKVVPQPKPQELAPQTLFLEHVTRRLGFTFRWAYDDCCAGVFTMDSTGIKYAANPKEEANKEDTHIYTCNLQNIISITKERETKEGTILIITWTDKKQEKTERFRAAPPNAQVILDFWGKVKKAKK